MSGYGSSRPGPRPGIRAVSTNAELCRVPCGWPQSITELSNLLLAWLQRARERRQLDAFGDAMLKDMGVSRADVEREVRKPMWRK